MQPTPVFLPGKSHGLRSLADYSPWGRKELDTTDLDMKLVLEMICHHFTWFCVCVCVCLDKEVTVMPVASRLFPSVKVLFKFSFLHSLDNFKGN